MTGLNALIIDDETDICLLLAKILLQLGINTSYAVTLDEGMKSLNEGSYNLLFLDNNLPDGSGLEQLPQFIELFPELKVIMISAFDGDKERDMAKKNGAIDFIGKPLSGKAIRATLKNHFSTLKI